MGLTDDYPPGPWKDEPDKVQWIDPATHLDCLIVRQEGHGALCGYVGVGPDHPLHGKHYDELGDDFDVHDGITFSNGCNEDAPEGRGVCHVPVPGRPADVWWFGFACLGYRDLGPGTHLRSGFPSTLLEKLTYKPIAFVEAEVAHLANQLAAVR